MTLKTPLAVAILFATVSVGSAALAQAHDEHEQHAAPPARAAPAHRAPAQHQQHWAPAQRAAPPAFTAHAPGQHPQGAKYQAHPVRVLAPRVVTHGSHVWAHWDHPEFTRPAYYWNWGSIRSVSCVAEDSYGDQYPVTESAWSGFALGNMNAVEDDALDRCYSESGSDQSCYLATCSHF